MTEDERRRALQSIFSQNAEYAKIYVWLKVQVINIIPILKNTLKLRRLGTMASYIKETVKDMKEDID